MDQAPNIDGILITWGDRLFYPGNRVVKVKPQPRLSGDAARMRAAAIRKRIEATCGSACASGHGQGDGWRARHEGHRSALPLHQQERPA